MKTIIPSLLLLASLSLSASPAGASSGSGAAADISKAVLNKGGGIARPVYPVDCIVRLAAKKMNIAMRDDIPVAPVRYESEIPLKEFQDAIEPQWGMRPDFVLNAYIFALNRVYILDDAAYYEKVGRFVDDSIFHEFVHYFQVQYRKDSFENGNGEFLEMEAIDLQTWFRDTYMIPGVPAAEACRF